MRLTTRNVPTVTWAGQRSGYGSLVEVNHGNSYITRYAHNQRTLVTVGQTVTRGQAIALMGSTGRSTGPHVHFEVLKNGRQINPASYLGGKAEVVKGGGSAVVHGFGAGTASVGRSRPSRSLPNPSAHSRSSPKLISRFCATV